MKDVLEFEIGNAGLGTTIVVLSLFFHANKPVVLRAPSNYRILREVKEVFDIPDEKLNIITQESVPNSITTGLGHWTSDYAKFWSPYFAVDSVKLFGKHYKVGRIGKPCMGIVTNNGWWSNEFPTPGVPFNRYYSKDFWLKVVDLVLAAGYDIITLNTTAQTLEQKIYMINECCDAVIGSEGGITHLTHLLKVPNIVLPWHHHEDGSVPHPDGSIFYAPHKMHLDRRTYFVKSEEELLSWTPEILREQIKKLYLEQGNNVFFNCDLKINPQYLAVDTGTSANQAQLNEKETEFVQTHLSTLTVGGM